MRTLLLLTICLAIFVAAGLQANAGVITQPATGAVISYKLYPDPSHDNEHYPAGDALWDSLLFTATYTDAGTVNFKLDIADNYNGGVIKLTGLIIGFGINGPVGSLVGNMITVTPNEGTAFTSILSSGPAETNGRLVYDFSNADPEIKNKDIREVAWSVNLKDSDATDDSNYIASWEQLKANTYLNFHAQALVGGNSAWVAIQTQADAPPTTPEPATMLLIGLGMLGAGVAARRRIVK